MKWINSYPKTFYFSIVIIVCITALAIQHAPSTLLSIFKSHWFALLIILCILIHPRRQLPLGNHHHKPKISRLLTRVVALQLIVYTFYSGSIITLAMWQKETTQQITEHFHFALFHLTTSFGLYPWGWVTLYAIAAAWIAYHQQNTAIPSQFMPQSTSQKFQAWFSEVMGKSTRSAGFAAIATLFTMPPLIITTLLNTTPPHAGATIQNLLASMAIVLLFATPPFRRLVKRRMQPPQPVLPFLITVILMISVVLTIMHAMLTGALPVALPHFMRSIQDVPTTLLWSALLPFWWLCAIPLLGLYIARWSCGYAPWQIVLAVLLLPSLLALSQCIWPNLAAQLSHWPKTMQVLGLIGGLIAIGYVHKKPILPTTMRSTIDPIGKYKFRPYEKFVSQLLMTTVFVLYVTQSLGMIAIAYMVTILSILSVVMLPIIAITLYYRILTSPYSNNQNNTLPR